MCGECGVPNGNAPDDVDAGIEADEFVSADAGSPAAALSNATRVPSPCFTCSTDDDDSGATLLPSIARSDAAPPLELADDDEVDVTVLLARL